MNGIIHLQEKQLTYTKTLLQSGRSIDSCGYSISYITQFNVWKYFLTAFDDSFTN